MTLAHLCIGVIQIYRPTSGSLIQLNRELTHGFKCLYLEITDDKLLMGTLYSITYIIINFCFEKLSKYSSLYFKWFWAETVLDEDYSNFTSSLQNIQKYWTMLILLQIWRHWNKVSQSTKGYKIKEYIFENTSKCEL